MNRGIFGHPRGNLRDGLQPFPSVVKLHPWAATSSQSGNWTIQLAAGRLYDGEFFPGGSSTDYLEWPIILARGTWTLQVVATKFHDSGFLTWSIDGVVVGKLDLYDPSAQLDVILTIAGIQVGSSGKKLLRAATLGDKNVAADGIAARFTHVAMTKTA